VLALPQDKDNYFKMYLREGIIHFEIKNKDAGRCLVKSSAPYNDGKSHQAKRMVA
jgi:hypothetical protein